MASTLITTTPRSSLDPQRYQGILVSDSYAQIQSALSKNLGQEYAAFFAEPAQDASGESIDWYTDASGPLVKLRDLPPDALPAAQNAIQSLASAIMAEAKTLQESPETSKNIRGHILELALRYPGVDYIYMAGNQPVLTGWGFLPASAETRPEDLIRLGSMAQKKEPDTPQSHAVPTPEKTMAAPVPPAVQRTGFNWLRALLALLAGVLLLVGLYLLAGLLLGPSACSLPSLPVFSSPVEVPGAGTPAPSPGECSRHPRWQWARMHSFGWLLAALMGLRAGSFARSPSVR